VRAVLVTRFTALNAENKFAKKDLKLENLPDAAAARLEIGTFFERGKRRIRSAYEKEEEEERSSSLAAPPLPHVGFE